jgi:hypothetical protein
MANVSKCFFVFMLLCTIGAVAQAEIQLHDNFTLAYTCKATTAGGLTYRNQRWEPAGLKTNSGLDFTFIVKRKEALDKSQPYCAAQLKRTLTGEDKPRERLLCVNLRFKGSEEEIEKLCQIKRGINVRLECDEYVFYEEGSYFRFGHRDPVATKQASVIQGQCKYSKQATAAAKAKELPNK